MQIHELNNFTGTLGANSYVPVDNGTDTGKVSTQQILAATEARIDNIIAGPAPSAEEIVDARLGADGVVYPSLGDAIRDQVSDLNADLLEIGENQNFGYLANVDSYYINSSNAETSNGLMSHTDYIRIPDNAKSVTVRGYTANAAGTSTYSINPHTIVYDANKNPLHYYGTSTKSAEKTNWFESEAKYIRVNQPGGYSQVDKLIRFNFDTKSDVIGCMGTYDGAFTSAQQQLNTGITLHKNATYCIKFYNQRTNTVNIYGLNNSENYKTIMPWETEAYFINDSTDRVLMLYNPNGQLDDVSIKVFEADSVQLKAEAVPRVFRVSQGANQGDYTSLTKCLFDLKDDIQPKIIEVCEGDYDIYDEYKELWDAGLLNIYTGSTPETDFYDYCVWIPANTHIKGKGLVRLKWMPDPAVDSITPNQCRCISPVNVSGSMTLENVELHCKNGRYCIHNDSLGKTAFFGATQKFINVRCYKYVNDVDTDLNLSYGFQQCVGFGIDRAMHHVYENCIFIDYGTTSYSRAFYGHSRATGIYNENENADITLTNCAFKTNGTSCVKFGNVSGDNLHIRVLLAGCYIDGLVECSNEGSGTPINRNAFDLSLIRCGDVILTISDTSNPYPPQSYGTNLQMT